MEFSQVAAKWWGNKLRHIGPGNFNNGDSSSAGGFGMVLATMLAMDSEPSNDSIILFESKLAEIIEEEVNASYDMILSVDYAPDSTLGNLANELSISTTVFPWKTVMWITKDKVSVRDGYGAPVEIIFPC